MDRCAESLLPAQKVGEIAITGVREFHLRGHDGMCTPAGRSMCLHNSGFREKRITPFGNMSHNQKMVAGKQERHKTLTPNPATNKTKRDGLIFLLGAPYVQASVNTASILPGSASSAHTAKAKKQSADKNHSHEYCCRNGRTSHLISPLLADLVFRFHPLQNETCNKNQNHQNPYGVGPASVTTVRFF